ncbi:MAG: neuromedin U [Pseudomonadota bacterium]
MSRRVTRLCLTALLLLLAALPSRMSWAQESQKELAKESQNPLGDIISFTSENNTRFGLGPEDAIENANDLRLVYPLALDDWTLINRPTLPVVYQGERVEGEGSVFGLGDLNYQGFFVPPLGIPATVGFGPSLFLPTATDDRLGSEKWSAGPAAVIVAKPGPWLFGTLVQNVWSFAGDSDAPDVNFFSWQYFINYNLDDGWYLTSSPTITANWEASSDDRWTVPVGGGVGKLVRLGNQPIDFKLQGLWNAEKPAGAADWTLKFQVKFLFPK